MLFFKIELTLDLLLLIQTEMINVFYFGATSRGNEAAVQFDVTPEVTATFIIVTSTQTRHHVELYTPQPNTISVCSD